MNVANISSPPGLSNIYTGKEPDLHKNKRIEEESSDNYTVAIALPLTRADIIPYHHSINPADQASSDSTTISYSNEDRFGLLKHTAISAMIPFNETMVMGVGFQTESIPNIPITSQNDSGEFYQVGSFSDEKNVVSFSVAQKQSNWKWGVGLKALAGKLYSASYMGTAYDVGVSYGLSGLSNYPISVSASVNNIGTKKWSTGLNESLPMITTLAVQTGISLGDQSSLHGSITHVSETDQPSNYACALQYRQNNLSLTTGGTIGDLNSVSFGAGVKLSSMDIEYQFKTHSDLGASQQITVEYKL